MEQPFKQNPVARKCPSCGADVPLESKFCLKCGHELTGTGTPEAERSFSSKLLRHLPWIAPLFVGLLSISVYGLFLDRGSKDAGTPIVAAGLIACALAWIAAVIAFFVQLIRRKGKMFWSKVGFSSFAALIIIVALGTYMDAQYPGKTDTPASTSIPSASSKPLVTSGGSPTGGKVDLARQTVPATGGTITINKPGDALTGLQITVPSGAYKTATNFTVSYQNVKSANPDYTMASPLISIDNGGGFADQTMTLKVPVKYGADDFPMLFYIDVATGEMEGIPTMSMDAGSVTVGINHFCDIVAMRCKREFLQQQVKSGAINTGFSPGQDDWSFENNGTYLSSGGNCAGMSLSSIWYFVNVSKGKTNRLYTQYPGDERQIHEDDRDAWRLVSLVQNDFDSRWLPRSKAQREALATLGAYASSSLQGDEVTYYSFLAAMSLSRQPQLLGMDGADRETAKYAGHAMIVYGVNSTGLMVADPNLPGNTKRVIPYTGGKFGAYFTNPASPIPGHPNAGYKYEVFTYIGNGAIVPFQAIAARNMEVIKNPTAITPFPDYKVTVTDDQAKSYTIERDTFTTDKKKISLSIDPSGLNPVSLQMSLYRDKSWINKGAQQKKFDIELKQGANLIGIYVQSQDKETNRWTWTDFKWVTITYKPAGAAANPIEPPKASPVRTLETWKGKATGTASNTFYGVTVNYSLDFSIEVTFLSGGNDPNGVGTITGTATVLGVTLDKSAQMGEPNTRVTGGPVNNGKVKCSGIAKGLGEIWLLKDLGDLTMSFGNYTNGKGISYPMYLGRGIVLIPESITDTSVTGKWRFGAASYQCVKSDSPAYRFTLTKQ